MLSNAAEQALPPSYPETLPCPEHPKQAQLLERGKQTQLPLPLQQRAEIMAASIQKMGDAADRHGKEVIGV